MEDQLISFETAKLAKEKNFDIKVLNYYNQYGCLNNGAKKQYLDLMDYNALISFGDHSAPTQSLLQKYLRDDFKIHIIINPTVTDWWTFGLCNIGNENIGLRGKIIYDKSDYNTFEDALEEGLKTALKLIK